MLDLSDDPQTTANDYLMARQMAEALHEAYPGHLWAVTCEGRTGLATVRNLYLSGNWGFVLKLADLYTASDWKKQVIQAGGEVLERYNLARGRMRPEDIANLATDTVGRILGDKT